MNSPRPQRTVLVLLLTLAALSACGGSNRDGAAPLTTDASDATAADAREASTDSGRGPRDAGNPSHDAPSPGVDAEPDGGLDAERDAGLDAGCDPSIPLSASVGPINDPSAFQHLAVNQTPCPDGFGCTFQDLQVEFTTCAGPVSGFRFRYYRPVDANIVDPTHVPALISEPGTGNCWVGTTTTDATDETAASNGAIVLEVAPRGHSACYKTGDALYQGSDWLGPATYGDYDRLLLGFVDGSVDTTLKADKARLGIHGVSHGGISSFFYARASHVPAIVGEPFALVMPEAGNPDLASWSNDGFDPTDLLALITGTAPSTMPWGSMRLDGMPSWEAEYPGMLFAAPLAAATLANDGVATFAPAMMQRSAHDDLLETDVTTFARNAKHFVAFIGTEDCVIPHQGAFDFYNQLEAAAGTTDVRLVSPVIYHACGDSAASLMSTDGYLPKATLANNTIMSGWTSALESAWISRYLIGAPPVRVGETLPPLPDPGPGSPTAQPEWMFMLADEGVSTGSTIPSVYMSSPPGSSSLSTTNTTFTLSEGVTSIGGSALGLDGGTAKSLDSATLSYDPGTDTVLNIVSPRWNQSAASEIDIDFPITTDDFVVVGQPDLVLFVNETSTPAQEYSFTVLLEDIRPGQPTPWPVGSGRRYSHTNTGVPSKQEILMDTVKSRFKNGDTLRVVITNIALMTPVPTSIAPSGEVPMYAPAINKFTVAFQSALAGESATLTLPTIPASSLVLAPPAWQIMQH